MDCTHIVDWFTEREEKYQIILSCMVTLLKDKCEDLGIAIAIPPEHRIKDRDKVIGKIERKRYVAVNEFTDYAGCRLLFEKQKDANLFFDDLISDQKFIIDKQNTIDKRLLYGPDRFGYISHHIVVSFSSFPKYLHEKYPSIKFDDDPIIYKVEIQLRTLIQHVWGIISRHLMYDNMRLIPFRLRKRFYRLIAVLETIDSEIEEIFDEYYSNTSLISNTSFFNQSINQNNLKKYLELQVDSNILIAERLSEWISDLNYLQIGTIGDFHSLLIEFYEKFFIIYKGKIGELIYLNKGNTSVDDFCGFPGWMIDAIIWHNPEEFLKYFSHENKNGKKRSDSFGHPNITGQYIEWLVECKYGRQAFVS